MDRIKETRITGGSRVAGNDGKFNRCCMTT